MVFVRFLVFRDNVMCFNNKRVRGVGRRGELGGSYLVLVIRVGGVGRVGEARRVVYSIF